MPVIAWNRRFQVRDEKRVFHQYWADKFMRIFLARKRFRLLAPFQGSTVVDPKLQPDFSPSEIRKLWQYMRVTRGLALESYPFKKLRSNELLAIDYEPLRTEIEWLFPRSAWQISQLWRREYVAWLATESERMNWHSWSWHPDWEVCGIYCCVC